MLVVVLMWHGKAFIFLLYHHEVVGSHRSIYIYGSFSLDKRNAHFVLDALISIFLWRASRFRPFRASG